jgi:superfamily II DNA helicase RecQ
MPNEMDLDKWEKEFYLLKLGELYDFTEIQHGLAKLLNYLQEHFSTIVPTLITSYRNHITHFYDEVINVAERFAQQYLHILHHVADPKDKSLQDRFAKACNYFIDRLIPIKNLIESTEIPTDSQELKKYLSNNISELKIALLLKHKILAYIQQNGFDPIEYTKQLVVFSMNEQIALEEEINHTDIKADKKRQHTLNQHMVMSSDIQHPELYHQLTTWRAEKAKTLARPAYTILKQKAILGISALLPRTTEELLRTPYIGKVTVDNYGLELLKIVINYCTEKCISTPELVFEQVIKKEQQLP